MTRIFITFSLISLISCSPKTARQYTETGYKQAKKSNVSQAESSFRQALTIDSLYLDAYIGLGQLYMNSSANSSKGLDYFDKAIKINIKSFEAWNGKGYIYLQQKNYEKAIDNFSKAIEIKQTDKIVYYQRGYARYYLSDTLYKQDYKRSCDFGNFTACEILEKLKTEK